MKRKKPYISPLDGKPVTEQEHENESKYVADLNIMLETLSYNLEDSASHQSAPELSLQDETDKKYIAMYNTIIALGVAQISEADQVWLKAYLENNKTHWYNAKFDIIRRK